MDEHGQKNEEAAAAGKTPTTRLTIAATVQLWRDMRITSDDFIRTEDRHTGVVQEIFSRLRPGRYLLKPTRATIASPARFLHEPQLNDGTA